MDTIVSQVEFYTKSGVINVSNQGAKIRDYIYALVDSNIEFTESSTEAIDSFVEEIKFLGKGAKSYNLFCRDLISKKVSSEKLIESVRDDFEQWCARTNQLEKNVADFISENHLTVRLENKTVSITKKYEAEMNPEELHEQASGEQASSENPIHSESGGEQAASEKPTYSESGGEQASSENPIHSESGGEQAASEKPTYSESGGEQAASEKPTYSESGGEQVASEKPIHSESGGEQAASDKSFSEEFSEQFPQESGGEQVASENPIHSESGGEQVGSENPIHSESGGEQVASENPTYSESLEQVGSENPIHSESGGEQVASENPTYSESLEQVGSENPIHSESGGEQVASENPTYSESLEQVASENPTCSESFSTESLSVSSFSDKNLLADSILCEVGFPLYSNKKGLHPKKFSHSYTSAIGQPELKITVTKVPSGQYKVFFGVSYDLNLSFSNIKKIPFEKQNRINLRIKNTTVKAYCSLDTPTSEVSVSIGQMFQVNNQRCGISGNFTFKEKKFQPQNFSFQTQVMTAPIVKTVKTNTCCMVTPSLGVEIFPFLDVNTLTNTNISEKSNNLLVQTENTKPVGLEAKTFVSENIAHKLETYVSQPLLTLSENYEIPSENMGIVMVQSKPEQGVAVDPNPPSGAFIQRESNTMFPVGVFGVGLIIGYICIRYVKKMFFAKKS